jgi:hypothetical protein
MSALGQLADHNKSGAKILSSLGTYPIALSLVGLMMMVEPRDEADAYMLVRGMVFLLLLPLLVSFTSKNTSLFSTINALLGVLFLGAALFLTFT